VTSAATSGTRPILDAPRAFDDGRPIVAMTYSPPHAEVGAVNDAWARLRDLWLELPPHPHLIDALERGPGDALLVRYAALDLDHAQLRLDRDRRARATLAGWGVQIASALRMVVAEVAAEEVARFLRPIVWIDVGGAARVGFAPCEPGARCDEHAFVYAVGQALRALSIDPELGGRTELVLDRCVHANPAERYQTLDELCEALRRVGGDGAPRTGESLASWTLAEEGYGWLALGSPTRALGRFEDALELDPHLKVADRGWNRAIELLGIVHGSVAGHEAGNRVVHVRSNPCWDEAVAIGRDLESRRAFTDAIALYLTVHRDPEDHAFIDTAIARCHVALGSAREAIVHAEAALADRPDLVEAIGVLTRALALAGRYDAALESSRAWIAAGDANADAHYALGRVLLRLRRYHAARDAFDRACALRPEMVEAIVLRGEAHRAVARLADELGTQPPQAMDLPVHLGELRDAIAGGRVAEAIAVLEGAEYAADGEAALVLARCLAFAGRYDDALAAYERAVTLARSNSREP
jgi:tetratricopeptide (TPR) repeat protein